MTKKTALSIFLSEVPNYPYLQNDKIALREAWNVYTDNLCKNRRITEKQYNNWANPF